MYARTNKCYNERGSRTNYVRSGIPHCRYMNIMSNRIAFVTVTLSIEPVPQNAERLSALNWLFWSNCEVNKYGIGCSGVYKRSCKYRPDSSFSDYRHSFNVTQTTFLFVFRRRFNNSWSPTMRCTFTWLMLSVSAGIWLEFQGGVLSGTNSRGRNAPFYFAFFRNVTPAVNMYCL